jgi:hypothetical protein
VCEGKEEGRGGGLGVAGLYIAYASLISLARLLWLNRDLRARVYTCVYKKRESARSVIRFF